MPWSDRVPDGQEQLCARKSFEKPAGNQGMRRPVAGGVDGMSRHHNKVRQPPAREFLKRFAGGGCEHRIIDHGNIDGVAGNKSKRGGKGRELADDIHVFLAVDDDAPAEPFELRRDDDGNANRFQRRCRRTSAGTLRG